MAKHNLRRASLLVFALASSSVLANKPIPIISEGKAKEWQPAARLSAPDYPPGAADIGSVCVNIGYYLGKDGAPSEFAVLKAWSELDPKGSKTPAELELFEKTAVATLMQTRFVPTKPGKPRPMYTSTTFVFAARPDADHPQLRSRCEVPNLPDFVAQAQRNADPATWNQIRWNSEWFHAKNTRIHGLGRE